MAELGGLFRSSKPVELTESETEYVVSVVKHIFPHHLVLQFNVTNTLNDQQLQNVTVTVEASEPDVWEEESNVPLSKLPYGATPGVTYVVLKHVGEEDEFNFPALTFTCELKFTVYEVDPSTGEAEEDGFEEDYPLEDLEVTPADFMVKMQVPDFRASWEEMGNDNEVMAKFALEFKTVAEAVAGVMDCLGMQACENSAQPQPKAKTHNLFLSGTMAGACKTLARAQLTLAASGEGTILKIGVRSDSPEVSQLMSECIR
jgi:coatomer protein complex subunit gamma